MTQRAMLAAELANLGRGRPWPDKPADSPVYSAPSIKQADAAKLLNVGERIVLDAKAVREKAPDLANLKHGANQHRTGKEGAQICAPSIPQPVAAQMLNVSRRSVQDAAAVKRAAPDLAGKIRAGEAG